MHGEEEDVVRVVEAVQCGPEQGSFAEVEGESGLGPHAIACRGHPLAGGQRGQVVHGHVEGLLGVDFLSGASVRDGEGCPQGLVSLDDDGIRPFAIIDVPNGLGGRLSHVRFDLRDEDDALQYVFEEEKWLQEGENILLPDYRLPIRKKVGDLTPGAWSAHVSVDGGVMGIHNFNLSPSLASRRRQMAADGEVLRERVWRSQEDDESLPLSLEELLRQQSQMRRQQ